MGIILAKGVELYKHQTKTLEAYLKPGNEKFLNASEMGTGKTLPTALLIAHLLDEGAIDRYILVVPKILIWDWYRVFKRMMVCKHQIHLHHGPDRKCTALATAKIIITSYQTFVNDREIFKLLLDGKHFGMMVDECQNIRRMTSKQSKWVRAFAHSAAWVQFLSGNPAPNGLENYYPLLSILTPGVYANEKKFLLRHTVRAYGGVVVEYKNTAELSELIAEHSIRFLKKQCLDLPETIPEVIELDMGPEQLSLYTKLVDDMYLELPDGRALEVIDALPMLIRCRQMASNPRLLGFDIESPKFEAFAEDLEGYPSDKKVVVFCEFIGTGYRLKQIAEEQGRNVAQLFDTQKVNVDAEKERFKNDPACTVVVANAKSAGVGVDFSVSSFNIMAEYSHDLNFYSQAIERSSRPGLKEALTIRHYAMRETVEPNILVALQEKQDLVHDVLRDPAQFRKFLSYKPEDAP
jgi:SNF2 family DNA or RNA helicase